MISQINKKFIWKILVPVILQLIVLKMFSEFKFTPFLNEMSVSHHLDIEN